MGKNTRSLTKARVSLLVILIVMVFAILLVSSIVASLVSYTLVTRGIIPDLQDGEIQEGSVLAFGSLYMAFVSIITGTILARFLGGRFLRQIQELADATKEVAAGNFNVRLTGGRARETESISNNFNNMVKELSNIETLRSDFVSNISHEFKTPISSIRGFARRLKKNSLTDEQRNEYLDIIISESERLTRLSSNVLLMSKLENTASNLEKEDYSLDEQIRRTVLLLEPQLRNKNLDVDIALESVRIMANEEMLSDLWINIFGNAIKFSPEGGEIKITLTSINNKAVVTVTDNGIGMSDEVKKHIFDKFYQGDKSRLTEGTGLGLPLVKRILELENGEVKVESQLGKGSTFTITL